MASLRSLTLNGVKWYLIGDSITIAANFVIGIILARLLTPEDFGIIGVYGIFFALAEIFINGGFSMSLIQKKDMSDLDCSTAFWSNIIVGIFFFLTFELSSPLIASFFNISVLTDIIRVSAIGLLIGSFTVVQTTLFTKRVDFRTISIIRFSSSISAGLLCVFLAYKGLGLWSLVIQGLTSGLIRSVLLWIVSKWRPKFEFSWQSFKMMFSFGGRILGTRLLDSLSGQASAFVLGKAFSPRDLGYYQKGAAFSRLLSTSMSGALFSVSFPVLTKTQDDETLLYIYRRYIKVASMVIFFMMLLLCVLARPMIIFLYTDKWEMSAILMQIVILGLMFDHIIGLNQTIFNVKGRGDILLRLQIAKTAMSLTLLCLLFKFGIYGVCVAEALFYQFAIAMCGYQTKKIIGYGYFSQMKDILPYLLMSGIAVSPAFVLTYTALSNLAVLLIGGITSILFYISILIFRKDPIFLQYVWNDTRIIKMRTKLKIN